MLMMIEVPGKKVLPRLIAAFFSLLILAPGPSVRAQGGPPMFTDDPDTPGDGMWEINFLSTMEHSQAGWIFETPIVDVNYGLGPNVQLKIEAPWIVMKERREPTKSGPGNSKLGIKWRFLVDEGRGFAMSIYPQIEFNNTNRSVERGLVEKGRQLFLPVEGVKQVGPVEINGEIGYCLTQHGADQWEYGLAVSRQLTKRLELIGELHVSALRTLREGELLVNAGSRLRLNENAVLLFSAGRTIRNAPREGPHYVAAFGIQFGFRTPRASAWKK
jgi:hypothetical protein